MTQRSRLLMCPPQHFSVLYSINPWMDQDRPVNVKQAHAQWQNLASEISRRMDVVTVDPDPACPDMCFVANAGFVHGNTFVPSRFRYAERQVEEAGFREWFRAAGYRCVEIEEDCFFEGAGDALYDTKRNVVWMGSGPRTDAKAVYELAVATNLDVRGLELVDARFYHLDTCFCPLSTGHVLYFPQAFSEESQRVLAARIPASLRIVVSETDALGLACNAVDIGTGIIVNHATPELRSQLAAVGLSTTIAPLGEFLKAGGGAKCLCLPLPFPSSDRWGSRHRRSHEPFELRSGTSV